MSLLKSLEKATGRSLEKANSSTLQSIEKASATVNQNGRRIGNRGRDYRTDLKDASYRALGQQKRREVEEKYNKNPYGYGNIDLRKRPSFKNEDGSISTVSSMSFNEDGKEILIPTIAFVNNKAVRLSDQEAIDRYHKTGEYLGKFNSIEESNKYAEELHRDQEYYFTFQPTLVQGGHQLVQGHGVTDKDKEIAKQMYDQVAEYEAREMSSLGQAPTFKNVASNVGYSAEKLAAGTVDAVSDAGSYLLALSAMAGRPFTWGSWNDALKDSQKYYLDKASNGPGDQWNENIEKRYKSVSNAYRNNIGNALYSIGNMAPAMIAEVATYGASPMLDMQLAGKGAKAVASRVLKGALKSIKPSDAMLFLSAAGSSAGEGYKMSGDADKAMTYGALTGLGEVFTEKLFGGIGGTGYGDEIINLAKIPGIRKMAQSKVGGKVLDIGLEGVEEMIMSAADPVFQQMTVNPDATIANWREVGESAKQGILVSVLMNAMLYPVNRHNRKVAIKTVNSSTDAINAILENDAAKFVPLPETATEEEIKQRQEEIKAFRSAYIDALEEEMVKSNPELANRTDPAPVIDSADVVPTSATSSKNPIVANAMEAAKKNFAQVKQAGQSRPDAKMTATFRAEMLTRNGEKITLEDAKAASGYGDYGAEVLAGAVNNAEGQTFSQVKGDMHNAYLAGRVNKGVRFETDLQREAYYAGKKDADLGRLIAKKKAGYATVYGEESGFIPNDASKNVSPKMQKALNLVAKDLGVKVMFADSIFVNKKGDQANAAMGDDGIFRISANSTQPLYELIIHEPFHRMRQLATQEYFDAMNFAVQHAEQLGLRLEQGNGVGTYYEALNNLFTEKGISHDDAKILDELAAQFYQKIVSNDADALRFIQEMNKTEKSRNALQKFMDYVKELIGKLQKAVRKLRNQGEYAAAKQMDMTIKELETARKFYLNAYRATRQRVENRRVEQTWDVTEEKNTDAATEKEMLQSKDSNGIMETSVSYALKDEYWHTDLTKAQLKMVEGWIRKAGSPEVTKITDTANWYMGRLNGDDLFVIYSNEDKAGTTILYEVKGKQAKVELNELKSILEDYEYGRGKDTQSETIDTVLSGGWLQQKNGVSNNVASTMRGRSGRNVEVLQGQSQSNASRALWNVIDNLLGKQGEEIPTVDFSLKDEVELSLGKSKSDVQEYTDQEYRDYGWARENGILTADQNVDYRSKFAKAKSGQMKFPRSKKGEYIIPVSDIYDSDKEGINNVLVFAKGTIGKPVITSIIEIYEYDETRLDDIRRNIYDCERRGIQPETGELFGRYYSFDFQLRGQERDVLQGDRYREDNGYGGRSGRETSEVEGRVGEQEYSLKGEVEVSPRRTKELLDTIAYLKGQFETTKFAKADPQKLRSMTRKLLKEYSSNLNLGETTTAMDELYRYMANGEDGHPAAWDETFRRAKEIATRIAESALETDNSNWVIYEDLRNYLRSTTMYIHPSEISDARDFNRRNMGRMRITTTDRNAMGVDEMFQELAEIYPEYFNEDKAGSGSDLLYQMEAVLDSLRPVDFNPFSGDMSSAITAIANDMIQNFFEIPQAKPTFADRAEQRVAKARLDGAKKVEAQRESAKRALERAKASKEKALERERKKADARVEKMSENQKARVLRAKITRVVGNLSRKLVNPTDNQHIPQELQGVVAMLLESINMESNYTYDLESKSYKKNDKGLSTKKTKIFSELKKVYSEMASTLVVDPDFMGDDGLLSEVIAMSDKRIADMTSAELELVWQTVKMVEASIFSSNKIFSAGKFAEVSEVAELLRKENKGKDAKSEYKYVGGLHKLATLDMLTPETYLHCLGSAGDEIFRMMRNAQDKHISIMKEVADFTQKTLGEVDVKSLEKTIHTVKLGGEDVKITTAQLMELYVLTKREQAFDHIFIGGILPDTIQAKGIEKITKVEPSRGVTIAEIGEALSVLTKKEKAIAEKLQKYMSTTLSGYGNEASMKVYNYEKFLEKNYWPIRTNKQEVHSDVGKDTAVTTVANRGFTRGTKPNANNSVCIGSIFDTFATHSSDMATYAAWLGTSEDVNRIRNFVFWEDQGYDLPKVRTGTIKGVLETVHGKKGSEYLEKLLSDIAIGVKGTDNMNPFDKFIGNYKAASVGANIRVIIQQPTALYRALDLLDGRYLAEGAVHSPLKGWEKAKKYAPIAQWKDWGYFDINTGRQMKDVLFDDASILEKTKQVGMWGASMADSISWGHLWNSVEAEIKSNNKELHVGSAEYYEAVAKRFTEIVDHTQVVDGILQRSQVMRSGDGLVKMASSFMGEPTKQYNMAFSAAYDARNGAGKARKKALKRLGRTATALAVSGIMNVCAQSIIDALRDDDKEKEYWEKWLAAFGKNALSLANPFTYVVFVKDIVSLFDGFDVKRMDTEAMQKVVSAVEVFSKTIAGESKYTIAEASAVLCAEIARLFGVPVANLKRDIKSLVMTMASETDNYLMQYRMEKAMLNVNYSGNTRNYAAILYKAYCNDREAYEIIYDDMIESGVPAEKIKTQMENQMKKAEGVEETEDLSKRYMSPDDERKYDNSLRKVKTSDAWRSASASQRKEAEAHLHNFITSSSESMEKTRAEARSAGVDETEYVLWQLATEVVLGEDDSWNAIKKADAIELIDLGDSELAYFYGTETADKAYSGGVSMENFAKFKADVSGLKGDGKKSKVLAAAERYADNPKEWIFFMGSEYPSYKKRSDYILYFGE